MAAETTQNQKKKGLNIPLRSFLTSVAVIFVLMLVSYILTFVIPSGEYARNADGMIESTSSFTFVDASFPFWKWILSPFLVLGADGSTTIFLVLAFLLIIGGVFTALEECNFMGYLLGRIIARFGKKRYTLLFVISGFFMLMGAFVGSFEECLPLVPLVVSLALALGWDEITGLAISLVAVGCGFATGILNPFTIGVAQTIAGVPMFSGMWLRIVSGVLIYGLLALFTYLHAKKVEKPISDENSIEVQEKDPKKNRALIVFLSALGAGILIILCSTFLTFLQDYTMVVIVLMFLVAGIPACFLSGMKAKDFFKSFGKGVLGVLPAIVMILMASSVKYILTEAKILDSILYYATEAASGMHPTLIVLFMYLIALVLNFFVPSGSAEAILLIPLLVPMGEMFGISKQISILAYVYGDGFSNVLYPTNSVLLIALGLVGLSYGKYFKWVWKLELALLVLTSGILVFAYLINY